MIGVLDYIPSIEKCSEGRGREHTSLHGTGVAVMSESVLSSAIDTASIDDVEIYILGSCDFSFPFRRLPNDLKIRKWDCYRPMYISSSSSSPSSPGAEDGRVTVWV
jgi:hypothetical protein